MDYSADPANNTTPNQHDYDELVIIYNHSDGAALIAGGAADFQGQGADEDMENPSAWGRPTHFDQKGRGDLYERDLGGGSKILTHVFWAE